MTEPVRKQSWYFRTASGKGGCMILPYMADANQALLEARLSIPSVVRVY